MTTCAIILRIRPYPVKTTSYDCSNKGFIYAQEHGRPRHRTLAFHLNNKKTWDNCRDGYLILIQKGMPASSSNKRRRKQIYRIFVLRLVARLLVTLVL